MGSPLWKRGVRGDFVNIFDSIGVLQKATQEDLKIDVLGAAGNLTNESIIEKTWSSENLP